MSDLVLLHPPSVYDFRKREQYASPVAETVPTSSQFEIPPIGFVSIGNYLCRRGFDVKEENLAFRMLLESNFDVEKHMEAMNASLFGIDLHWLVHAHGSLEIAKICKKYHPETPVVLGGLTASYFYRELIDAFPFVDYVIRGDAERPLLELLEHLNGKRSIKDVSNLCWRDNGALRKNPLDFMIHDLDGLDYTSDLHAYASMPMRKPGGRATVPLLRGCAFNCATCGGSRYAYSNLCGRRKIATRSASAIVDDLLQIEQRYTMGKDEYVFLVGDPRLGGKRFSRELLQGIENERIDLPFVIELFYPTSSEFLEASLRSMPRSIFQISPDSGVESMRERQGKVYSNQALGNTVRDCLERDGNIEVFFMLGLPYETRGTVMATLDFFDSMISKYARYVGPKRGQRRFHALMGPMILLDVGSRAFDSPKEYGYRLLHTTLKDHHDALGMPHWKDYINYETNDLSRNELVEIFLESNLHKIDIYEQYGAMPHDIADDLRSSRLAQYVEFIQGD